MGESDRSKSKKESKLEKKAKDSGKADQLSNWFKAHAEEFVHSAPPGAEHIVAVNKYNGDKLVDTEIHYLRSPDDARRLIEKYEFTLWEPV